MQAMKIRYLFHLILFILAFHSCMPIQALRFKNSDYHGKPKFKSHLIENDTSSVFEFYQGGEHWQENIGNFEFKVQFTKDKFEKYTIDSFLTHHSNTTAFIVIHNDTILYEKYFQGYDENSKLPSFSIAKGFTSALVGIAIEEGSIQSIDDPIVNYIPELKGKLNYWNRLTIAHLLAMRSGIDYQNAINYKSLKDLRLPYFGDANMYFSKNAMKVIKQAKYGSPPIPPGTKYNYSNLDNQLLGLVIERATGQSLSKYLEEKIWKRTGMEGNAKWGIDSKRRQVTKAYCCMEIMARDYARFARLYLNEGSWEGQQIVPKEWVRNSVVPSSYTEYTHFTNAEFKFFHQNQWWSKLYFHSGGYKDSLTASHAMDMPVYQLVDKVSLSHHLLMDRYKDKWFIHDVTGFLAEGVFGQYVYVVPRHKLIFIRLGKDYDSVNAIGLFQAIIPKIILEKANSIRRKSLTKKAN